MAITAFNEFGHTAHAGPELPIRFPIPPRWDGDDVLPAAFIVTLPPTPDKRSIFVAERVVVQLVDDINGAEITEDSGERIHFSVRGTDYLIDLSSTNVAKFEKALAPYLDAATKVGGGRTRTAKDGAPRRRSAKGGAPRGRAAKASAEVSSKEQLAAIREWAQKQGYQVAARGRIKTEVIEAFNAAH
ncbi:MAG: Lsr2 family protein [Mycobacterium sp.]|nr:Lsr2 family protein [Mycobacterium sp.]